jgi:hypothetical protein
LNKEFTELERNEIETRISKLEDDYSLALDQHSDLHSLSLIWQKIKELKRKLEGAPSQE